MTAILPHDYACLGYQAHTHTPSKTKRRFWAKFHLFSPYFLPIVPHPLFFRTHVYGICLFLPISVYFPPIFCLKWYPILVINSSMEPICCFSAHMFMVSAYFPPIFHSFSTYFPPNLQPIFRRSCFARQPCMISLSI